MNGDRVLQPAGRARQVPEILRPLMARHEAVHAGADLPRLLRAFDVATRWHAGRPRRPGDPSGTHPLGVATILADLGLDTTTLVAALLHGTVADDGLDQVRAEFGDEVARLVDGVIRLDRIKLGDAAKAETISTMMVAMTSDPRVLLIKLADRLHAMRTLSSLPRPKQKRQARETLEIMAPLAGRLGINTIRSELEDLAFQALSPERYAAVAELVREAAPRRVALLGPLTRELEHRLTSSAIKAEVAGRTKHLFAVDRQITTEGRHFDDIDDLVAVRVLVDTVRDCYAALGVIYAYWQPVPGRFEDYIATPKFNMYQSLRTTVIGPAGKPVEMQIRTFAMHRTAEFGMAARWKYRERKDATVVDPPAHLDERSWLRQLLDWQREESNPSELLDKVRFDLSRQEVYVFTPKGDVIALPTGSTPVDFAYALHTQVGHKCIGARVNGKVVALESALSNGSVVEIFMSRSAAAGPAQDWLGFVKSRRAHTKIRKAVGKVRRAEATEAGDPGERAAEAGRRPAGAPALLVTIHLEALDRRSLLADVTSALCAAQVTFLSATVATTRDRVAVGRFRFETADPERLGDVVAAVRKVEGVFDAYRVPSG